MKFILILMPLFLFSCMGKDVDIPLNFEGERLVLFSKLEANKPIKVQVNKTFSPFGSVPNSTTVSNARVKIFEDGVLYAELFEEEPGVYSSELMIHAGHTYVVRAELDGLPIAESENVKINKSVHTFSYIIKENVEPEGNWQGRESHVAIQFKEQNEAYLEINLEGQYDTSYRMSGRFPSSNLAISEEDCYTVKSTHRGVLLFNGACLPTNSQLTGLVREAVTVSYINSSPEDLPLRSIVLHIASISKEWFEYNKVIEDQPDGLDHMVMQSKPAYSNIKNGYGLVYGYNGSEFILK